MGFFDIFKKKKKVEEVVYEKPKTFDNFLEKGARFCDYLSCNILGKTKKLSLVSNNKDDMEELDDQEINEINWLVKSNLLENKEVQKQILNYINLVYKSYEDDFVKRELIEDEFDISYVAIDINKKDLGDTGEVVKIVAFCGEAKCDEEHGISISFKNRNLMSVQDEATFNYDNNPSFDPKKWLQEHPLTMVPKSSNPYINKNLTDESKVCFVSQAFYGQYSKEIKSNLKRYISPEGIRKSGIFNSYVITKKGDELYLINSKTSLESLKNEEIIKINKNSIIDCFVFRDTYKVNAYIINHFASVYYVLNNGEIVIFGDLSSEEKVKFLLNFGNAKEE